MQPRLILKDTSHQTATFVVLEPDTEDRNGHVIEPDEIVKTAHEFMLHLSEKSVNVNHEKGTDVEGAVFVESFVLPEDLAAEAGTIKRGSWLVAIKFPDDLWADLLAGEISGVSMEGWGYVD